MEVSIILVGYRNYDLMRQCVESIVAHTREVSYELIVVSNDQDQVAKGWFVEQYPGLKWIEMGYNSGFSRANNRGIEVATGKYILLLNPDTLLLDNDVLLHCVFRLNHRPDIVACSVQQLNRKGEIAHLYHSFAFRRWFYIYPSSVEKLMKWLIPEKQYDEAGRVDWLSGAFTFVRKETVAQAGLMDEDFFLYAEDVEWCSRLGRFGKLMYYKDLEIIHLEHEDNPHRAQGLSFVNRFTPQIQLSNLLWVRKQFGLWPYVSLMMHYAVLSRVFFLWKYTHNLLHGRPISYQLENQKAFAAKTRILFSYFWKIVFKKPHFYKL